MVKIKKYSIDYFIKKFKSIPTKNWYVGAYWNPNNPQQKCALGHCGETFTQTTQEAEALRLLWSNHLARYLVFVNDIAYKKYKTPKGRIVAALRDMKKKLNK